MVPRSWYEISRKYDLKCTICNGSHVEKPAVPASSFPESRRKPLRFVIPWQPKNGELPKKEKGRQHNTTTTTRQHFARIPDQFHFCGGFSQKERTVSRNFIAAIQGKCCVVLIMRVSVWIDREFSFPGRRGIIIIDTCVIELQWKLERFSKCCICCYLIQRVAFDDFISAKKS
jgi:hypothetical protein